MDPTSLFKTTLKSFIKKTRKCKRKTEERIIVLKELAEIRTKIKKDCSDKKRKILIEKLLYIHLIGFRTNFCQVECLKLAGCSEYYNKRIGYLGCSLLLNETEETFSLSVNLIKGDIQNTCKKTLSLCLSFISNSCFEELLVNVSIEIKKLLSSLEQNIRQRASFSAAKIVKYSPSFCDLFYEGALSHIKDQSHSVIMGGVSLFLSLCSEDNSIIEKHRKHVETYSSILRELIYTQDTENSIDNINNPFLQIKIVRLLRLIGQNDIETSSKLTDILGLLAIKTCDKNRTGVSVLYEVVVTILTIETEYTLRTMAINVIGRLLSTRDVLVKYAALRLFEKAAQNKKDRQTSAIQRHRQTIANCLKEDDPVIRKKAFGVLVLLIDDTSLFVLTEEALLFLEKENKEIQDEYSPILFNTIKKYQKEPKWFVENAIRLISICGDSLNDSLIKEFISFASNNENISRYTTYKLYQELNGKQNDTFVIISLWFIGYFGDLIVDLGKMEDEFELLNFLVNITKDRRADIILSFLISLARFACRVPEYIEQVTSIIESYCTSEDTCVQQKAIEYVSILSNQDVFMIVFKK